MESTFVISEEKAPDVLSWVESDAVDMLALAAENKIIPVAGGDGTMLHAIHELRAWDLPFFGIDRGTKGFLLNPGIASPENLELAMCDTYKISLSLLSAHFETRRGEKKRCLAFNDIFLNVLPGRVCYGTIAGQHYPKKKFSGDGIIVCTPQGSTAYHKTAGGSILPLQENLMGIRTICCRESIRDGISSQPLVIEIQRGHMVAHADSQEIDDVVRVEIFPTDIRVQLAFRKDYDFRMKRYL